MAIMTCLLVPIPAYAEQITECRDYIVAGIEGFLENHGDTISSVYDGSDRCQYLADSGDGLLIDQTERGADFSYDFISIWDQLWEGQEVLTDLAIKEAESCARIANCNFYLSHEPNACNLITNGSFNSIAPGWRSDTSLYYESEPALLVAGPGALRLYDGWVSTVVNAEPNTEYQITGYIAARYGNNEWVGIGVDFLDSAGNEIGELVRRGPLLEKYQRFTLNQLTPQNTAYMRFWGKANGTRVLNLDEIEIFPVGCTDPNEYYDAPDVTNPGLQENQVGDIVNLPIIASDPNSRILKYTVNNLPYGLSIDENTGLISGRISDFEERDSTYLIIVTVSNGLATREIRFRWSIDATLYDNECNLLENGSFDFTTDGWSVNAQTNYSDYAAEGSVSLSFSNGSMNTYFPLQEGAAYELTGQYRMTESDPRNWRGVGIDYLDGKGREIGEDVVSLIENTDYTRLTINSVAPPGTEQGRLWFSTRSSVPFLIDNLVLIDLRCVPEQL